MLRRSLPLVLALVGFATGAAAEGPPAASPGGAPASTAGNRVVDGPTKAALEKQRVRFSAAMRPELRARVLAAAHLLAQRLDAPVPTSGSPRDPQQLARQIVSDRQSFPEASSFGGADVEALVFVVLMEASKGAEDDLKSIMASIKALDAAKACVRSAVDQAKARSCIDAIAPSPPMTRAELDALLAAAKDNADSLGSLDQTMQARLQMAMDRLSKLLETLSNLLKQISATDSGIVSNLK